MFFLFEQTETTTTVCAPTCRIKHFLLLMSYTIDYSVLWSLLLMCFVFSLVGIML